MVDSFANLPVSIRILGILVFAILSHLMVKGIRNLSRAVLTKKVRDRKDRAVDFSRQYPRFATIVTLLVSAVTFVIYFFAVGMVLKQLNISLTTYLASASVIGLAIGFGLQGFVQDLIIGLTLIFSDALNIGDIVEISGQIGKVDSIGLRFTSLVSIMGQRISIPNRNIGIIGNYRKGAILAYMDIHLPESINAQTVIQSIMDISESSHQQHRSIILSKPENLGMIISKPDNYEYLRLRFRLWPGQGVLLESIVKQRILSLIRKSTSDYADWMITVTYRTD